VIAATRGAWRGGWSGRNGERGADLGFELVCVAGRFTPVWPLGIVIQATKNDVAFLQFVDSGLQAPYCALEMAWFLIFKSAMEIVHVSPATVFHVRQALTVKD
jgi:hypothetical protein